MARLPEIALTIIGAGPYRQHLETVFQGTDTFFAGALFGEDLACAFASADVFVFPSKTDTFGLVTLEAMASALPVVAFNSGAAHDLVIDGLGFIRPALTPSS